MKTLLTNLVDLIKDLLDGSAKLNQINSKLNLIIQNQELLAHYLGMTPGGATSEELAALFDRIKAAKEQVVQFDQQTTNPPSV